MEINEAVINFFRCPEDSVNLGLIQPGLGAPGFFKFGPEAIGYGQVGVAFASDDVRRELHDASSDVRIDGGACLISFDPGSVVENLRRERYVADGPSDGGGLTHRGLVRKAYYAVRPILPVSIRKYLQRISLRGWNQKPFPRWPVDRSVDQIFERLMLFALKAQGGEKIPFIWFWPEGKSACAVMTHDVETKTGLDFCSSLMDLNDSYGIKSSFQIIPEGRYHTSQQVRDEIERRGFEVDVHDWNHDGHLYSDRATFLSRAVKINRIANDWGAQGFRSGVLYRNTDWYDEFTFSYDMSVPNVGHLDPQPGGCCTTFPYFIGKILEIPLTTTQDYPLFHVLRDYSIDLWKKQIGLILQGHGLICTVVHPDYIIERRARATYSELLAYLAVLGSAHDVWQALPRDVNRWWRDRAQMGLIRKNGRWEIEGPGSERARVAYASLEDESLAYTLSDSTHDVGIRA